MPSFHDDIRCAIELWIEDVLAHIDTDALSNDEYICIQKKQFSFVSHLITQHGNGYEAHDGVFQESDTILYVSMARFLHDHVLSYYHANFYYFSHFLDVFYPVWRDLIQDSVYLPCEEEVYRIRNPIDEESCA